MDKPTSDKKLLEYQKEVCCTCDNQFNLQRGRFTKGCKPVDLFAMTDYYHMFKEDGTCNFYQEKK